MRSIRLIAGTVAAVLLAATACTPSSSEHGAKGAGGSQMMVIGEATLRISPNDDTTTTHPLGGSTPVYNFIGQLTRGKVGRIIKQQGAWSQVVLDDDAEGWVHTQAILPMKGVTEATVLQATPVFPQAGGKTASAVVMPGALLFVVDTSGGQSKVQMENQGYVWIDSKALVGDEQEIAMGHLIIQARSSARIGDLVSATDTFDEAKTHYPTSSLMGIVAEQLDQTRQNAAPATPPPHSEPHY